MQLEKKVEKILALAADLAAARAVVARVEGELALLLGGPITPDQAPPPVRAKKKLALSNGTPAKKGERQAQVVALAKEGFDAVDIAEKLGVATKIVNMALWRARKAGLLPKAGAKET